MSTVVRKLTVRVGEFVKIEQMIRSGLSVEESVEINVEDLGESSTGTRSDDCKRRFALRFVRIRNTVSRLYCKQCVEWHEAFIASIRVSHPRRLTVP